MYDRFAQSRNWPLYSANLQSRTNIEIEFKKQAHELKPHGFYGKLIPYRMIITEPDLGLIPSNIDMINIRRRGLNWKEQVEMISFLMIAEMKSTASNGAFGTICRKGSIWVDPGTSDIFSCPRILYHSKVSDPKNTQQAMKELVAASSNRWAAALSSAYKYMYSGGLPGLGKRR